MTSASPSQSQPVMMGARPKGSSCSVDSRHSDFASPPREEATEPYRTCAGRMMLDREDWTHYAQQDEARPGALHLEWLESLRTVGPIRIPAGYEGLSNKNTRNRMFPPSAGVCCEGSME